MEETKYKQTEIGLIPEEWEVTSLGKVCAVKGRIGFRGYTRKDLVDESNGAITLSPANIIDGILSFENCTYISWYKYFESPEIMAELGDIVFTKTASVGKTALIRTLPKETTINPQLVLLKNISCNSAFLSYILQDVRFQNDVKAETGQGCVPNVPQSVLEKIEVPLPPLPEQHAIASALTSIDNLITSLDKQIAKTHKVKHGAMQQLLTGLNSEMVEYKKLGDICISLTKETLKITQLKNSGYPVINSGREFYGYYTSYNNEGNAITIASRGEYAGFITYMEQRFWAGGLCYPYRSINEELYATNYLYFYLKGKEKAIMDDLVERASIPALNKADIELIEIPIPSIETQHRIASTLTAIDDQISALEAKRRKYEMVKVGMMQQLLTGKIRLK